MLGNHSRGLKMRRENGAFDFIRIQKRAPKDDASAQRRARDVKNPLAETGTTNSKRAAETQQ
jgi:hypothetical protein